jgi:hypothetical protein
MTNEWNKLKKRKTTLPEPLQEASENIYRSAVLPEENHERKYSSRYIKRTGRVVQFATRVTPEFDQQIRQIASQENCYLAEVLEKMMKSYLREKVSR